MSLTSNNFAPQSRAVMRTCAIMATLAAAACPLTPAVARPMHGYAAQATSLYAGPLPDYPIVRHIRRDAMVSVHGCLRDLSWCDVTYRADRGWMAGDAIVFGARNSRRGISGDLGIGILSFAFGTYWDNHYRTRGFYGQRSRWQQSYDNAYRPEWGERNAGPRYAPDQRWSGKPHPQGGQDQGWNRHQDQPKILTQPQPRSPQPQPGAQAPAHPWVQPHRQGSQQRQPGAAMGQQTPGSRRDAGRQSPGAAPNPPQQDHRDDHGHAPNGSEHRPQS